MGTSKNRFEKGKWVECAECDESRRSKAVCLTRKVQHDVAERNNRATAWTPSHQKFRSLKEAVGVLYTFSLKQGF